MQKNEEELLKTQVAEVFVNFLTSRGLTKDEAVSVWVMMSTEEMMELMRWTNENHPDRLKLKEMAARIGMRQKKGKG